MAAAWAGCTDAAVKHTLYEDPVTHKFALVRLPNNFIEGDKVPVLPTDRWFDTREEVERALVDLLSLDG